MYKILDLATNIHWVIFALTSLAAAYTHYYALIAVAFFYVVLWGIMLLKKKFVKQTLLISVFTVIGYMPWLGILLSAFERTSEDWWVESIPTFMDGMLAVFDYRWLCWIVLFILMMYIFYQLNIIDLFSNGKGINYKLNIRFETGNHFKISNEMIWILAGTVSVVGMLLTGLLLSYIFRPLFVVRYLYTVTPMAYLILGVCMKKLHFSRIWTMLLISLILWNNVPIFFNTYQSEKDLNKNTSVFLEQVQPEKNTKIYTNNLHLNWSLLEYYYPENQHAYVEELTNIIEENHENICLYWVTPLEQEGYYLFENAGYSVSKNFEGTFANGVYYYVYSAEYNGLKN